MNTSVIKQTVEGIFGTIELGLKVSTNKIELSKEFCTSCWSFPEVKIAVDYYNKVYLCK